MIEAGIDPGDLVVVRKQNTAEEGEIVVALVDNETTLKRFYTDKKRRCVRLHPENRAMQDIYTDHCHIQGRSAAGNQAAYINERRALH